MALVARKGRVILSKGYGFADYGKAPNTPETLFEIATVIRQFTAAAILKLEMEKELATSDTLEKFFRNVPEDKKTITVQHLLDYLRAKIFEPAGLANTGFIGDRKLKSKRVSTRLSKLSRECTAVDWYWGWASRGTGGVVTSAVDLLAWDQALRGTRSWTRRRGRNSSPRSSRAMRVACSWN